MYPQNENHANSHIRGAVVVVIVW